MRVVRRIGLLSIQIILTLGLVSCDSGDECLESNKLKVDFSTTPTTTVLYENETYLLEVPNFITPNGDNVDDFFEVYLNIKDNGSLHWVDYAQVNFVVYDKCIKVHTSNDNDNLHWDGKIGNSKAPEGVYYFDLFAVLPNNDTIDVSDSFELHRF